MFGGIQTGRLPAGKYICTAESLKANPALLFDEADLGEAILHNHAGSLAGAHCPYAALCTERPYIPLL